MDLVGSGAELILGFAVIPIWLLAGLADYFCHRAAHIEDNSGPCESVLHLIQFGLVGIPICAGLFLEIDAGLILLMTAFLVLHHVVAYIDVRYADRMRHIAPLEQMVHSCLEMLPVTALLFVMVLNFSQVVSLFGYGSEPARFVLAWKAHPLPASYIIAVLVGALVFGLIPYLEEFQRTLSAKSVQRTE
jgi:hypothetical protein